MFLEVVQIFSGAGGGGSGVLEAQLLPRVDAKDSLISRPLLCSVNIRLALTPSLRVRLTFFSGRSHRGVAFVVDLRLPALGLCVELIPAFKNNVFHCVKVT